jgi:hypothetical protein
LVLPFQDGVSESNDLVVRVALVGSRDFFSLSGLKHQKKIAIWPFLSCWLI